MQPEMSYERGYCRPECTKCAEVCPAGAIRPITRAEKSSVQVGHAVWVRKNCVPLTDGKECGNCARHCPTKAIEMVPSDMNDSTSLKIPVINTEKCIGCGACENLCPARPFSAIYIEGHKMAQGGLAKVRTVASLPQCQVEQFFAETRFAEKYKHCPR